MGVVVLRKYRAISTRDLLLTSSSPQGGGPIFTMPGAKDCRARRCGLTFVHEQTLRWPDKGWHCTGGTAPVRVSGAGLLRAQGRRETLGLCEAAGEGNRPAGHADQGRLLS